MNKVLHVIGHVVHSIQLERGLACLYQSRGEGLFDDRLNAQFRLTDSALDSFKAILNLWTANQVLPEKLLIKMTSLADRLGELPAKRKAILAHDLTVSDIINFYSDRLVCPFITIIVEIAFSDRRNSPVHVSAFSNFLNWKEAAGLERALGLHGMKAGDFKDEKFNGWLKSKISEQSSNKELFLFLADENQVQCLKPLLESPVEAKIEEINGALIDNIDSDFIKQLDALGWFDLMSQKINLMREVEVLLVDTLVVQSTNVRTVNKGQRIKLETGGAGTVEGISYQDKQFLDRLPLFCSLPQSARKHLLKHMQIDTYNKGKILFMEGEQATRLYVIFHGWVKLFKNSRSGEETILQMFSGGDTLAESAVFLNVPLLENAQVVEPARIMTIPAPIVREQVRINNELAVNMLTSMSRLSSNFMRQIETTRLKTADQRVGWFLLKMMLEQHRISQNYVDLPFDKAIMASYLDMKPETLSRSLKRFRELGFDVGSDRIQLPHAGALCGFCDDQLAGNCEKVANETCARVAV